MGKVLFGIILGSAATIAAFLFLDLREQEQSPEDPEVSVQSIVVAASESSDSRTPTQATSSATRDFSDAEAISPAVGNLEERIAAQRQLSEDAQAELIELNRRRVVAELGPVVTPLPLPQEFDWLGVNLFRERMQRETIDPLWAGSTEAQLWDYIGSRPQLAERYGMPTIRCHSVRCQLTWMAYGSSETRADVTSDFRVLRDEIEEQLPGIFDSPGPVELNVQDGVVTVVWGLTGAE